MYDVTAVVEHVRLESTAFTLPVVFQCVWKKKLKVTLRLLTSLSGHSHGSLTNHVVRLIDVFAVAEVCRRLQLVNKYCKLPYVIVDRVRQPRRRGVDIFSAFWVSLSDAGCVWVCTWLVSVPT